MLQLVIPLEAEKWDEDKQEFIPPKTKTLQLEHSLVSLSKWESKWNRPFLSAKDMSDEETIDYIKCMTLTPNVDPKIYDLLTNAHIEKVRQYIIAPMTATVFSRKSDSKGSREVVTAELIYYWMITLKIPFECRKWHLNQLITLIKVCDFKNNPPKKRSKREIMSSNAALNAARKKKFNTKG